MKNSCRIKEAGVDPEFSKDLTVTMSKRSSGEVARALYKEQGKNSVLV